MPEPTVPHPQSLKDRRRKGAPKKPPREEATVEAAAHNIPWLSKLLQGVEVQDDSGEGTVISDSYSKRSPAEKVLDSKPTSRLAAVAAELVADAFGPISDPKFQDDLEGQEEQIEQDIGEESGISDMAKREGKLVQHACDEFAKLSETTASKSALLEENLGAAIAQHVDMGMNPEEAAEEAMLNLDYLLGNQSDVEAAHVVLPHGGDDDAAIAAAAASRSRAMNSEAFRRWVEEVALSAQALQFKVSAQNRAVGEGGELSLVFGKIAEPKAGPAEGSTEEEESQSVFWVHWKFAGELGRPATLDGENRVKCLVATGKLRDARDYRSVEILIPAVGVKMERVRGFRAQLRPQMPETSMRLHDMYQTAILAKDSSASSARLQQESQAPLEKYMARTTGADECFVCGSYHIKHVAQPGQRTPVADRVQTCPFCLLPGHFTCRSGLVEHAQSHEVVSFPPGVDIESLDLPDHFDADEPHLCRSQSSVAVTVSDRENCRLHFDFFKTIGGSDRVLESLFPCLERPIFE